MSMISAGVEGRIPYMTYPEPWRGPPKQPPELFLRPAPKPPTTRYNGVPTTYPNGTRLAPPPRPVGKYPSPPNPVNLAQPKEDLTEDMSPYGAYRIFPQTHQYSHFAYPLCQPPYMQMRTNFPPTPLSPIETYSPTATSSFLTPPSSYSPPSSLKSAQMLVMDKKTPPLPPQTVSPLNQSSSFKVPSGKEGSLKHRILIRPEETSRIGPLDLQKPLEGRKRLQATMSPPRSPKKSLNNNNLPGNFAKGSLIQLSNGDLRRIEDLRTEDFIMSAERSPEVRLAESTVVKIEENQQTANSTITLTYNNRRDKVEMESTLEQPYFVMGHGWASCCPERTQQLCGLKTHRLQVGDVLISLTPRERRSKTTTPKQQQQQQQPHPASTKTHPSDQKVSAQTQPMNLHYTSNYPPQSMSPDSVAARKRRWSAPDQMCDEEEQNGSRRHRIE
ncbi:WAS/WASL-interacting protein family member 3 isoform X2 [Diorhabda sublineata]|uniref:WAS/WASL-interacting protein family member 3 isoform X2 n=1 Tax=Diorhabda sublineata TaxID=1163346 RepID=UPI0024E0ADDC|nr:WAS/WASL-interacting protein family member 3 isoform X2 [Diorhabda sublineata]